MILKITLWIILISVAIPYILMYISMIASFIDSVIFDIKHQKRLDDINKKSR